VPVQVGTDDQPAPSTPIEILLAGGRSIRITPGFDPATLRQLLAVLQEAPPC
jgi:transposase